MISKTLNADLSALSKQDFLSQELIAWQSSAREALHGMPFPSRRDEAWRYVPHRQIPSLQPYVAPADVKLRYDHPSGEWDVYRIHLTDGMLVSADIMSGVQVTELSQCDATQLAFMTSPMQENDAWITLNQAYLTHGVLIDVSAGTKLDKPLVIIDHVTKQCEHQSLHPRYVVQLGDHSSADVIMHQSSDGACLVNAVTQCYLSDMARFSCLRIQQLHKDAVTFHQQTVIQEKQSESRLGHFPFGAAISREAAHVLLQGKESRTDLSGVFYPKQSQFSNMYTHLTHAVPHTYANQQYRGIMCDASQGVFYGRVHVLPQAQKTASYQKNANLLLGKRAQVNSKPELEIYADDVICSHGSTTGQLDDEQLFYLRSRGIPESQAYALLVDGFARAASDQWKDSPAYAFLLAAIAAANQEASSDGYQR